MPPQVGVEIEWIRTRASVAFALATNDHEQPAREALAPLLADGGAKVEEYAYVLTRSGSQAQVESIVEMIYPTEYHHADLVKTVVGPISAADQIRTPATPTDYQTRNLGLTLKVTPQVGPNGKWIEFDVNIDKTSYAGDDSAGQHEAAVTWPKFHSQQITTNLVVRSGTHALLGVVAPVENASEERFLAFIRATTLPIITLERAIALWFPGHTLVESDPEPTRQEALGDPFAGQDLDPFSEPEPSERSPGIRLLFESVQAPKEAIASLMSLRETSDATTMRKAVTTLIQEKRATVTDALYASAMSAEKGAVRSGNEQIYAVEMSGSELPNSLKGPIDPEARLGIPTNYSTHEMRAEGLWADFDAQVGPDNTTTDLSIALSDTTHLGNRTYAKGLSAVGMPLYATSRIATNASFLDGDYTLLGIVSPRASNGTNLQFYNLIFVRNHIH
jgi:hypothetical protein